MNPAVILRIFVWVVVAVLLVAAAGFYRGDFMILRWVVSIAGIILIYTTFISRKFYWLTAFIIAVIVFNPIVPLYLKNIGAWRIIDAAAAVLFGIFLWRYYDYYGKGYSFEYYIASLFPAGSWTVMDKTRDFSKALKRSVESDSNPDFTFRHIKTGKVFAVECKYRSYFFKGGIDWDKRKGDNYRIYGKSRGIPVFVAIGVGGNPKNPLELFFVPLEKLNNFSYQIIPKEELALFKRKPRQQFISIEEITK